MCSWWRAAWLCGVTSNRPHQAAGCRHRKGVRSTWLRAELLRSRSVCGRACSATCCPLTNAQSFLTAWQYAASAAAPWSCVSVFCPYVCMLAGTGCMDQRVHRIHKVMRVVGQSAGGDRKVVRSVLEKLLVLRPSCRGKEEPLERRRSTRTNTRACFHVRLTCACSPACAGHLLTILCVLWHPLSQHTAAAALCVSDHRVSAAAVWLREHGIKALPPAQLQLQHNCFGCVHSISLLTPRECRDRHQVWGAAAHSLALHPAFSLLSDCLFKRLHVHNRVVGLM